jgi:hypothetical protein
MVKKQMAKYIQNQNGSTVVFFKEEREYAEKNQLLNDISLYEEKDPVLRFKDAYIERCDKETENILANESFEFLNQPISYLKKQKKEFIYMETNWFDLIDVDAVSLEVDDVFETYDVMLGLKLQKKFDHKIREYLNDHLHGDEAKFDLLFNQEDGLWNLNFTLNYVEGFQAEMTIGEAFQLIYRFLFKLSDAVEAK